MSREITADFDSLLDFLKKYSITKHTEDHNFIKIISTEHKKYFAYLTCIAELIHLSKTQSLTPELSDDQILFLKESCSDIGNAYFVMIHGAYKPSRLMLRSSIETFLKGFTLDEYTGVTTEKSLYKIFETVKKLPFFESELIKSMYDDIHSKYGKLSEDIHTATELNMTHVTALNYFPEFNKIEAEQISKYISELVMNYIALITIKYNAYFFKMHHKSREIILANIERSVRPLIVGIEK